MSTPVTAADLPRYGALMLPVLRAVERLGGSARANEITAEVLEHLDLPEEAAALQYPNREKSILIDRIDWARSYCKLGGALESPQRGLFLLSPLGRDILAHDDAEAATRLAELDRQVRSARSRRQPDPPEDEPLPAEEDDDTAWTEVLLARLHRLTPTGFEEFCMYLLRRYGLELTRVGGTGDEGIDGIGTAPLSDVLSATVAVQAKRFDPATTIGRDTVALFQRDAAAVGAERAVMITLGRFSGPARKAATSATPRVDLIDGSRLCELVRSQEVGVTVRPVVNETWFDRFDTT
jgi:restriction system protein